MHGLALVTFVRKIWFCATRGSSGSKAVGASLGSTCVCRPENATVRAVCLELLGQKLGPLKQLEAAGSLLPQV